MAGPLYLIALVEIVRAHTILNQHMHHEQDNIWTIINACHEHGLATKRNACICQTSARL
jgi:hypothetical protein